MTIFIALVDGALEEELGLEALADQPALHVGKGDEHGVDGAGCYVGFQLVQRIGGHVQTPARRVAI